ncbi:MAG: RHS repeat-associated core domain-containing protein [Acidimicrobiales bacterium]
MSPLEPALTNMRARWYDTQSQVFTTVDPAVSSTNQPYQFANGDPVNNSDPSGMATIAKRVYLPPSGTPETLYVDAQAYYFIRDEPHGAPTSTLLSDGWGIFLEVYENDVKPSVITACTPSTPSYKSWLASLRPFFLNGFLFSQQGGVNGPAWPDYLNVNEPGWTNRPPNTDTFLYWAYWNLNWYPQNFDIAQVLLAYSHSNGTQQSATNAYNGISMVINGLGATQAPTDP